MAGTMYEPDKAVAGQRPSARTWNRIIAALGRGAVGANVMASTDGVAIIPGGGGGSRKRFCVLRFVDASTPLIQVQQVIEQPNESKQPGETGQRYHIGAIGSVFEAFPWMNGTYAQFNMQGAIRPIADILEPEDLSGATLFFYNNAKQLSLRYNWAENVAFIDPEAEEVGGGGV